MTNLPTYGAILYDKDEICPHNKIATTVKKIYLPSDPVRLRDVCLMRKLGDQRYRPGSERDSCNYLWSVTLQRGTNPYVGSRAKNEPIANALLGLRNGVMDKMRRSFQRYRCHLTTPKPSSNAPMDWIMRPRELTSFSSQESILKRACERDKIKKRPASCPAAPNGFKKPDLVDATTARRPKLSLPTQFSSALKKSKKNLVNEKRRNAGSRIKGGKEQVKTKVLRKAVVVKKQLAPPLTKEEYMQAQPMEHDECADESTSRISPAPKLEAHAKKAEKTAQCTHQSSAIPTTPLQHMRPTSPMVAISPQRVPTAATTQLSPIYDKCTEELPPRLSDVSLCSTSKSKSTSLLSLALNWEFGEGFGKSVQLQGHSRLGQAIHQHIEAYPSCKKEIHNQTHTQAVPAVKPLQLVLKATQIKPSRPSNAQRAGRVIKRQTYRLYRILRNRGKRRRMRDKRTIKRLNDSNTPSIGSRIIGSSLSVRSAKSALLCEPSKEVEVKSSGGRDKSKKAKITRRGCGAVKLLNVVSNKPLQQPEKIKLKMSEKSETNEVGSEQSEFCISYHTPITLRALIQRRPRANRAKSPQQMKLKEMNARLSPERKDLLHDVIKLGKRREDSKQANSRNVK